MQSFENRTLQLETKPKHRISENSVQPQEDEGQSPKALPTARITAPSQLNPDSIKYLIFQQKFQINNLVSILILCLGFFSERLQIKSYFPCLDLMLSASSTLTVRKALDFQDLQNSRDLLERPHRQRLDFSLEP